MFTSILMLRPLPEFVKKYFHSATFFDFRAMPMTAAVHAKKIPRKKFPGIFWPLPQNQCNVTESLLFSADSALALAVNLGCTRHNIIRNRLDVRVARKVVRLEPVAHKLLVVAGGASANLIFLCVPETA